jgi:hypothetical protein
MGYIRPMAKIGYFLSCERFGPKTLVDESVALSGSERARRVALRGEGRARERLYLLDEFDQIREYFGDV